LKPVKIFHEIRDSERDALLALWRGPVKNLSLILLIAFCVALLMGCNTFRGLGKDIESLGGAMKKTGHTSEEQ
jgi:predicted small secreted protein